jgi:glycosyltransferase involved in cell wall biosynthesis
MTEAPSGSTTDRIQVLWLIKGLGVGGAEQLLVMSARHRNRARVFPTVAYLLSVKSDLAAALREEGVESVCFGARSSWNLRWLLRLRRLYRTTRFDVVHIHSPLMAIGARIVGASLPRSRRPRVIVTEHNVWQSHTVLTRVADRLTSKRTETRLAVSEAVRDSLPRAMRSRTRVVRYGIDAQRASAASSERRAVRESFGVQPCTLVVGTVANLRATKGYPDLLRAARVVLDETDDVAFVAIGRGPLEGELRSLHSQLRLGERFRLLGHRPDAASLMSGFDVFCLPSHHEGLPIALMEALAHGLPIVATCVGGLTELVTNGRDAVLVPPGRPGELAAALLAVLRDHGARERMSERALETARALDIALSVAEVEAIYDEVACS